MKRRDFLLHACAATATPALLATTPTAAPATTSPKPAEPTRAPPVEVALVKEYVGAGHGNIPRLKELLSTQPRLIHATYDWGEGDFETALGGASHVGRRDAALYLLEAGARIDAFCAAMLGEAEIVAGLLRLTPATANTRGPHAFSLLYHAGYSGKVAIAEAVGAHLADRARDCNQALHSASLAGHTAFVAWLLKNGVDNPNTRNFQRRTPLALALERKHEDVAALLRAHGGTATP